MKRALLYYLILTALFAGCTKKTDLVFEKPVDERLREALDAYKNSLMQAPGWKLFVYPQGLASQDIEVGGLTYYISFPDSNRARMVSDFTVDMAGTPGEGGFRLRATQRPSLVFDTYSYIHVAADPDETVSSSPAEAGGYGWGTDFDFSFTELAPKDTFTLKGNFNKSDALLIRATQEEMDDAFGGRLAEIVSATSDYSTSNPFLYFPASDNSSIGVSFNLFLYRVNFTFVTGGQLNSFSAPFSHTVEGIRFKNPVSVGGYTFQEAYWDDAQEIYYLNVGGTRVNIVNGDDPVFPFHIVLGKAVTSITVPTTPLPGQSAAFTAVYDEIKDNLKNGGFNLDLDDINFIFDAETGIMALQAIVFQDGTGFIVQYVYAYTINSSNEARFTRTGTNGNGVLVEPDMEPLLDYLENDDFVLDYYTGATPVLAEFRSQDRPSFFFTGNIQ